MLKLKKPEVKEKRLVLGDYVSVHRSGRERGNVQNVESCAVLLNREELFQRIEKERGALLPPIKKPDGDLIDVRLRAAAAKNYVPNHYSEISISEGQVVA